ncbi:DUF2339 domain-containing protein [Uliginosibacterium sp. sgz301328]|uniref:DUF2339 domain-containing protein n=1 Tax=Uliginosibacterium sp. sgz301328 TaxID=3243764 RepID=UPI00359D9B36
MDSLFTLGAILAIFYVFVVPVLAIMALSRANEARRQLDALQRQIASGTVAPAIVDQAEAEAAQAEFAAEPLEPIPEADVPAPPVVAPEPIPAQPVAAEAPMATIEAAPAAIETVETAEVAEPAAGGHRDASPMSGLFGWLFRGNPLAKIGVLLLFFGLAYLFKYSVDHDMLPIELRLAGAGLLSLGLLGIGWRLRHRQPLYALILQGGAVGAFYLTAFASFRLYHLLPSSAAFALMIVICAASVALAVVQRAQSLAVVAALGGYLAPVLLSTGGGSHIGLFSYYGMLSAGILTVSVWQIWRPLNLVGFVFTFGVAALWADKSYVPAFYLSCQLFLILNLVIFGILAPLAALRHDTRSLRFVDGTLVFGTPLVAFGFQYALMRQQGWMMGAAFSALILGAIYLPLARTLMRRWPEAGRRLAISFIALGGGFVTLAIPLALSARWTSLAWALEGVGVAWVGVGQRHRRMAWSGSLLVALAAASAAFAWPMDTTTLLLVFGVLALSLLTLGWVWRDEREWIEGRVIAAVAGTAGVLCWLWWVFEGAWRVGHYADIAPLAALALSGISALLWERVGHRLGWPLLRHAGWSLWLVAAGVLAWAISDRGHPLVGNAQILSLAYWLVALACAAVVLRRVEGDLPHPLARLGMHAALCWIAIAFFAVELMWRAARLPWGWDEWRMAIQFIAVALPVMVVAGLEHFAWPVREQRAAWWLVGLAPTLPVAVLLLVIGNFFDGQLPNWQYVPLLNPLEESAAFSLLMLALWRVHVLRHWDARWRVPTAALISVLAVWWLNGALVRALAYYGGVEWDGEALWDSRLIQTTLALVWTIAALALMLLAKRRASRPAWMAGAGVLAVVVVKLFLVDSARGGGLARAVAFIGVALLILLIGYVAPLPPRKPMEAETST